MLDFAYDLPLKTVQFVGAAPLILVGLIGIAICLFRRSRPARVRWLIAGGLVLLLASPCISWSGGMRIVELIPPAADGTTFWRSAAHQLIPSLLTGIAVALLLHAAFSGDARRLPVADNPSAP